GGDRASALKARDDALCGAHAARHLGLCKAGPAARPDQLGGQGELRTKALVFRPELRVLHPALFQLSKLRHVSTSRARRRARSSAALGVFCVFFTKACTITTRWPVVVR